MPAAAAISIRAAEAFVKSIGDAALDLLSKYNQKPSAELRKRLKRLISENFDLAQGTRFVVGRYWRSATGPQQSELLSLLPDYALEVAAGSFTSLSRRRIGDFEVVEANHLNDGEALVRTTVPIGGVNPLVLGWRVRDEGNHLKIIDVTAGGVSMEITLRDIVEAEISRSGIRGLIAKVRAKLIELRADP